MSSMTSRSVREATEATRITWPPDPARFACPTTTVAGFAGVPGCWAFSGTHELAVSTHCGATSAPVHARPSVVILATNGSAPSATGSPPPRAMADAAGTSPPAASTAATTAILVLRPVRTLN